MQPAQNQCQAAPPVLPGPAAPAQPHRCAGHPPGPCCAPASHHGQASATASDACWPLKSLHTPAAAAGMPHCGAMLPYIRRFWHLKPSLGFQQLEPRQEGHDTLFRPYMHCGMRTHHAAPCHAGDMGAPCVALQVSTSDAPYRQGFGNCVQSKAYLQSRWKAVQRWRSPPAVHRTAHQPTRSAHLTSSPCAGPSNASARSRGGEG